MAKQGRMFRISKPYGYHIEDVEQAINKYNDVISELKQTVIDYKNVIKRKDEENEKLKNELKNMHMQLTMLEVPGMSHAQENLLLNQFSKLTEKKIDTENIVDDSDFAKSEEKTDFDSLIFMGEDDNNDEKTPKFGDFHIVE